MKKLMIAAAIVCAAAFAQAGTVIWGFDSDAIVGPTSAYDIGGYIDGSLVTAYLYVLGDDGTTWNPVDDAGQNPDYTFGNFAKASPSESEFVDAVTKTGDPTQTFKMLLVTNDGKYQLEYVDDATVAEYVDSSQGKSFFMQSIKSGIGTDAGEWSAVPEPTSGLLLLIGVAGLALRRRRA